MTELLDPQIFLKIKKAMKLFIVVEILFMFNIVSYLLKIKFDSDIIKVIDRLWEIISMSIAIVFIGIGTNNIKDHLCKKQEDSNTNYTLQDFKDDLYATDTEDDIKND